MVNNQQTMSNEVKRGQTVPLDHASRIARIRHELVAKAVENGGELPARGMLNLWDVQDLLAMLGEGGE